MILAFSPNEIPVVTIALLIIAVVLAAIWLREKKKELTTEDTGVDWSEFIGFTRRFLQRRIGSECKINRLAKLWARQEMEPKGHEILLAYSEDPTRRGAVPTTEEYNTWFDEYLSQAIKEERERLVSPIKKKDDGPGGKMAF